LFNKFLPNSENLTRVKDSRDMEGGMHLEGSSIWEILKGDLAGREVAHGFGGRRKMFRR